MANDFFVTFGGDAGALESAAAAARELMQSLQRDMRNLGKEMRTAGEAADSDLGRKMHGLGKALAQARKELHGYQEDINRLAATKPPELKEVVLKPLPKKESGHGHGGGGAGAGFYVREAHALIDELTSDRVHQAQGTAANLFMTFAQAQPAMAGAAAGVLAFVGTLGYLIYKSMAAQSATEQLRASLAASGGAGLSDESVKKVIGSLHDLAGMSYGEAEKFAASLGTMQNGSEAAFTAIIANIKAFAQVTGRDAPQAAEALKDIFSEPKDAAEKLEKTFGQISNEQRDLLKAAQDSLDPMQMQAALQQVLAEKLSAVRAQHIKKIEAQIEELRLQKQLAQSSMDGGDAAEAFAMISIAALEKEKKAIESVNETAAKQVDILRNAASSVDVLRNKFDELVKASLPWAGSIEDATRKINQLRSGLQGGSGDAAQMIRQFESFSEKAYMDRSPGHAAQDHYAVGYGQHAILGTDVTKDTIVTRERAEEDLKIRIALIQRDLEQEIGASWARLSDRAKASLTSMAYNYGDLAKKTPGVIAAAQSGDESALAAAIRARAGDNGGVNQKRRNAEADNIVGAIDPARARLGAEAIAEQKQRIVEANEQKAGGNALDKAGLAILEQRAQGHRDEIAEAEKKLQAAKDNLAVQQTEAAQFRARQQVAQAENDLAEKRVALKRSELHLEVGRASDGDARARRDAAFKLADFEMGAAGGDQTRKNAALAQREAAERAYQQELARDETADEEKRFQNAQNALDERRTLLREQVQDHKIGWAQVLAEEQRIETERAALEKEHWTKLARIAGEGTQGYRQAMTQLGVVDSDINKRRAKDSQEANRHIQADFDKTFKSIGESISSSVMSMLDRTQKLGDVLRNIARQIVGWFVKAGVDMAMNWAASVAKNAMASAAGEQTMTAAAAAGAAARGSIGAGEAATGVAAKLASVVKSIMSSSAEAFAGVFGFMSPLMGPAAAGPAAAAQATVAGMASVAAFDIGAYNLPHDMMSIVHRDELIMPAAPARAFRDLLENGGGAGGAPTTVHAPVNLHIQALDAQSVQRFFKDNGRSVLKTLERQVRLGVHVGLKGV